MPGWTIRLKANASVGESDEEIRNIGNGHADPYSGAVSVTNPIASRPNNITFQKDKRCFREELILKVFL